jgi:hypothetical protein
MVDPKDLTPPSAIPEAVFNRRIGMERRIVRIVHSLQIVVCAYLLATSLSAQADSVYLGSMQADKILFLGNSITFCPREGSTDWWGASASTVDKDYAHLLTQRMNAATGGSLTIEPPNPRDGYDANNRWYPSYGLPNWNGNILNIADIFERNYNTWDNARIKNQLALKANLVVLQFGENMENRPLNASAAAAFKNSLRALVTALKESSNPEIFITGCILVSDPGVDAIKREIVAEDPTHRVFVDLSDVMKHADSSGAFGHPSDAGMTRIADSLFAAMVTHSTPEPSSAALLSTAMIAVVAYVWKKRKS